MFIYCYSVRMENLLITKIYLYIWEKFDLGLSKIFPQIFQAGNPAKSPIMTQIKTLKR